MQELDGIWAADYLPASLLGWEEVQLILPAFPAT